jgi:hypothetical protein
MIAYPWNPLWAKLHTLEERQQLFKVLEKEAMSAYHQIKTRPNTWLEALSAGILIVIALFEIGKYHTVCTIVDFVPVVAETKASLSPLGLVLALGIASVSCGRVSPFSKLPNNVASTLSQPRRATRLAPPRNRVNG